MRVSIGILSGNNQHFSESGGKALGKKYMKRLLEIFGYTVLSF